MTEQTLGYRLRTAKPISFRVEELAGICREFGVRPDYLLFGDEPMLHADLMDDLLAAIAEAHEQDSETTSQSGDVESVIFEHFAKSLHHHLTQVLAAATEAEPSWIASYLPNADDLLRAVERGVIDAVDANFEQRLKDRKFANECVRKAVADRVHQSTPSLDVPDAFFKSAVTALVDGTVISLTKPSRPTRRR